MSASETIKQQESGDSLAALRADRFHVLDGMRGIAAVLVMLYHYFNSIFVRYMPNVHVAVDFFFILSGFVVAHAYGDRLLRGMSAGDYLARRVARLWPAMMLGLLAGTATLLVGHHQGLTSYTTLQTAGALLLNLAFIPYLNSGRSIVGDSRNKGLLFPADMPLWSIFFEMVASLLFILLARISFKALLTFCGAALAAGLAFSAHRAAAEGSMWLIPSSGFSTYNILGGFPRVFFGFSCGMVLNRLHRARQQRGEAPLDGRGAHPVALYAALAVLLLFPFEWQGLYFFVAVALISPVLVALGAVAQLRSGRLLAVSEWLGVISYPLYCIHEPVHRVIGGATRLLHLPDGAKLYADLASMLTTVIAAWIIAMYVERQMQKPLLAGLRRLLLPRRAVGER